MLFDRSISTFESEKERNLYYKVFAGYLLNEFIPGYQDRLMSFCNVINNSTDLPLQWLFVSEVKS